jgi:mono/diheme cytochrome c family protein
MRKKMMPGMIGFLLLVLAGCGQSQPTAVGVTPVPSQAAQSSSTPAPSATVEPSSSITPAADAAASEQPSPSSAPVSKITAEPTPTATPKATATSQAAPKPTATPVATPKTPAPAPAPTTASNAKAEALFKANCMACHGASLEGDYGPNLTKVGSRKTKEQIIAQITNGGENMPALGKKLDADAIETLAVWLAAKK